MNQRIIKLGFWAKLKRGFSVLAPMEDVTDKAFRLLLCEIGRPDVFFTEFTNISGLLSEYGSEKVIHRLKFSEIEHPIVAQIWGKDSEEYYKGAKKVAKMGFDGIDINMGCPVRKVVKSGCGAGLIRVPDLAIEIIKATKDGAKNLPISVKTRMGFEKIITEEWIRLLLDQGISALTIHGRLAKEMSKFPANWDEVAKAVEIKNEISPETLIIGNGDIKSAKQGREYCEKYGCDGYMVGRGIFENPYFFLNKHMEEQITKETKIKLLIRHLQLYKEIWNDNKNSEQMRKFYKMYLRDFDGSADMRLKLMKFSDIDSTIKELETFLLMQ